ncbi:glycoside hydrolase family 97 protein [Portibacter lacus]|uniref:Alpha-glucosidase n=1 Tax=Portibacter lacus TaxID=1099794 RepID=A0AA37STV0_9BACT|nr:glycoside hydrolase family 97 protein [Portibacter lacus]GLR19524.1 alpha-glucosidase [Portibacter lacus]
MKSNILTLLFLLTIFSCSQKDDFTLTSPNGDLQIDIFSKDQRRSISVLYLKDTIFTSAAFGLLVNDYNFGEQVSYKHKEVNDVDETWKAINGKQAEIRNHYREYSFQVAANSNKEKFYKLIFRLYDDGFAYRYDFPHEVIGDSITIQKELTSLDMKGDYTYWAYNGEKHNVGPITRSSEDKKQVRIPMVIQLKNNRFMAIHEADISEFGPFSMNAAAPDQSLVFNTSYSTRKKAFKTSWRSFMLGENIGDLVESNLLENLNEPCKIEDPSWIKPGKSLWDWRVKGYKTEDRYTYQLNTKSHKRFIDFASKNNIQYLLIDADWYGSEFSETSDPTSSIDGVNIEECMAYAADKKVGIILYLNDVGAKKFGLEAVLKQFSEWGAVGVKYGFMKGNAEQKVKHTHEVVALCAKYKLMVDFHDNPIPPNGDSRTWPNLVAREYGHAQADAKKSYFPETAVNTPLINMIAGPLDLTNGWFDLNHAHSREKVFQELPGTVVAEVAKLIVIYSGWMVLPDSPEEYAKKDDLFDCIRQMPAQFDDLKVIDAKIDEYVSIARKSGEDWFIGSLTNREARTLKLDFSFLPENEKYEATIYEDASDSHFLNNKEAYQIRTQLIDSSTQLSITMGAGGGNAIHLKHLKSE